MAINEVIIDKDDLTDNFEGITSLLMHHQIIESKQSCGRSPRLIDARLMSGEVAVL